MKDSFIITHLFDVNPEKLFSAWLSNDVHSEMTGGAAVINSGEGAEFSAWDGYITGKNIKVEAHSLIRQSWRTLEFPDDAEDSILELYFEKQEESQSLTKLTLTHTNIPIGQGERYKQGWFDHYFNPIQMYFK